VRDWGSLDDRDVRTFDQRGNVRILRSELWTAERVLAVANAGKPGSRFRSGLLAVTTQRIIFVCERVLRRPFVLSVSFADVLSASVTAQPLSGTLVLQTDEGALVFRLIRPRERTWPLYWRIGERIGQLPLRGHS
jgi:hypothetical protein